MIARQAAAKLIDRHKVVAVAVAARRRNHFALHQVIEANVVAARVALRSAVLLRRAQDRLARARLAVVADAQATQIRTGYVEAAVACVAVHIDAAVVGVRKRAAYFWGGGFGRSRRT